MSDPLPFEQNAKQLRLLQENVNEAFEKRHRSADHYDRYRNTARAKVGEENHVRQEIK